MYTQEELEFRQMLIDSTNEYNAKKKLQDSQLIEIQEKVTEPVHEFNQIPTQYPPVQNLDKLSQQLLFFLEARSFDLNGDTKINDSRLCEYFKVSRSTIQRRLAHLKELGYINTIKKNFKDYSRLEKPKHTEFFSDRVIRCYRIVVQKRFKVLKNPGWKYDPRPKWNPSGIVEKGTGRYINRSWLLQAGEVIQSFGMPTIKPKWETLTQLQAMGIANKEVYDYYHHMNNLRYFGKQEGIAVLGFYKNRDEDL